MSSDKQKAMLRCTLINARDIACLKKIKLLSTIVLAMALMSGCSTDVAPAIEYESFEQRSILIENVSVVDTRTGEITPHRDVFIKSGVIQDVRVHTLAGNIEGNEIVIDGSQRYLVPGYTNMHTHVHEDPDPHASLLLMLANGITAYRDMSGSYRLLEQRRTNALPNLPWEPSVLAMPGPLLSPLNAHSIETALGEVHQQITAGADFIKVGFVSDEVFRELLKEFDQQSIPILGHIPEKTDVLEASRLGVSSIEHMGPIPGVLMSCSEQGEHIRKLSVNPMPKFASLLGKLPFTDQIFSAVFDKFIVNPAAHDHGDTPEKLGVLIAGYDENLCRQAFNELRENDTWMVPTMIRTRSTRLAFESDITSAPELQYVNEATLEKWKKITASYENGLNETDKAVLREAYDLHLDMVGMLSEMDVNLLAGDDAVGGGWLVPGFALHREFAELAKAGVPPVKILQMTTLDSARYFNREDSMGAVEAGKVADLVLLDADPTKSVANLQKINAVIKSGYLLSRTDLDFFLTQVKAQAER